MSGLPFEQQQPPERKVAGGLDLLVRCQAVELPDDDRQELTWQRTSSKSTAIVICEASGLTPILRSLVGERESEGGKGRDGDESGLKDNGSAGNGDVTRPQDDAKGTLRIRL